MFKPALTLLFSGLAFSTAYAVPQQLANYLGTGSNPDIHLELSPSNGPAWGSYNIDYGQLGNVPYSSNSSNQWSPWNVKDENGNYYGTITLNSDGNTVTWSNYVGGSNGYYLDGVHLSYNNGLHAYQLTVDSIHMGNNGGGNGGDGPFPNTPEATPAVYANSTTPIVLSTNGSNLVNDKGQTVVLKGVVRPSLEWNPQGQYLSAQDIQAMHTWGANVVRLDLNQNYWLSSGPVTQAGSYKQIINAIIYNAVQNNMAVILDLHWTVNGQQSPMANNDSITFWTDVANTYKNFGTVIFELFNEPYGIDQGTWLNGNSQYVGYQQLYNAVRATGAQNVCIVNGLDYGYDLSFVSDSFKVNGTNIVYGSHPYNEKGSSSYTGQGGSFANDFKGVLGKYPLIFTEFGVNQSSYFPSGYQTVYNTDISYADQNGISYTGFAWWVDTSNPNTFPDIIADWNGTPLNGGIMIHDDVVAHPGTSLNGE